MPWGAIGSAVIGAGASLLGGYMSNRANSQANQFNIEWARESQKKDQDFQREVYQNQYQWKAADARKAGLHPLAVIGGGGYSASPTSQPVNVQPGDYSFLGKMGDHIGDAFAAYKSKKDMAAEEAIRELREAESYRNQQAESEARTDMYKANAEEARARAQSYTRPLASGSEVIKGQVEASEYKPKFQRFREVDGSLSGRKPTDDYQGIHDDKPGLEYYPWLEAWYYDIRDYLDRVGAKFADYRARDAASRRAELDKRHARFNEHFPAPRW